MIDPDSLNAWHGMSLVGHLWRNQQDQIGFRYDEHWLESGFAIGQQLPLREAAFEPETGVAQTWFSNLLPEGRARELVIRSLGVADSDFTLLREIGGDCAGALSILPVEADPIAEGEYTRISDEQLHRMVRQRGAGTWELTSGSQRPRMSLAGAQAKCAVYREGQTLMLPSGAAASSHILKFEVPEWRHVPIYEAFLNALAQRIGLAVATTELVTTGPAPYLIIERYDRRQVGGELERLHQEDFCQLTGHRASQKYQAEGGPGFADCLDIVRRISEKPAQDVLSLLRWQAFNFLAGNADGHAKNLSMVQTGQHSERWRLSPFYDLVCTRAIPRLATSMAMAIGSQDQPGRVDLDHWRGLASASGMKARFVLKEVNVLAETIIKEFRQTADQMQDEHGELRMLQRPISLISRQCQRWLRKSARNSVSPRKTKDT